MRRVLLLFMLIFGIATVAFASDDQGTATPAKGSNEVELVFIVDKSGSMAGLESDTIGGFNSMLNKQKGFVRMCDAC